MKTYRAFIFRSLVLTFFCSFFHFQVIQAQIICAGDTINLSSPYHTIRSFLVDLQQDNYKPQCAAQALNFAGMNKSQASRERLAIQLIQILDGRGLYVGLEKLPREEDYLDSTLLNPERYILFPVEMPKIYLEKVGNQWLFSKETVQAIPDLHASVYPFGVGRLKSYIPNWAKTEFLGLALWQYLGLFALIILGMLFRRVFNFIFEKILLRYAYRFGKENVAKNLIKPVARPLSLFVLYLILLGLIPVLSLPVSLNYFVLLFLKISIQIFAIIILMRVVDFISSYLTQMAEKTSGTLDDQLMPLLRKSLKIIILTVGILYILQSLKFDITTLLTGLSIGTLAFALAAQDTIKNLFGSITIFVDRPFQVGDWIVGDGIDGSIEEVGFRSTRVRTFHNSLIYIPNGRLADMTIDNMGLRKYRRFRTMLSLTYDTPPALINAFVDGVRQIIQNHPDTRKDYYHVYMNNFSAASLDVLFYAFFLVPDWTQELRCRHEVMLAILELADQLGVRFAFPTQTIHIEDFPGQKTLTPQYAKSALDKLALKEKVESFVEEYYDRPRRNSEYRGKDSGINEGDSGE